jgi:hypothetical protein
MTTATTGTPVDYQARALAALGAHRAVIDALPPQYPVSTEIRTYASDGPQISVHVHAPAGLYEAARLAERLGLDVYDIEDNTETGLIHHRWHGSVEGVAVRLVWLES